MPATANMASLDGAKDLYAALGVPRDASQAAIKKAYHKLALQLHPDKQATRSAGSDAGISREEATRNFQTLQRVFGVLGDESRRKLYDETGCVDDAEGGAAGGKDFDDLYAYYREFYREVTDEDVEAFERKYRGSAEEEADLLRYYASFEGDMGKVFAYVMCSRSDLDAHRFMDAIRAAVERGAAPRHARFDAWAARTESKPRPKADKVLGGGKRSSASSSGMGSLVAQIRAKGSPAGAGGRMDDLIASLEAKYAKGGKKKKGGAKTLKATGGEKGKGGKKGRGRLRRVGTE